MRPAHYLITSIFFFLLLSGCASRELIQTSGATNLIELGDTPYFPQQAYRCGPAALATLLTQSGVPIGPEQLTPQVFLPKKRGSLQLELISTSRYYDRIPYTIDPDFKALRSELEAGRPVLVLQNLGKKRVPVWHYAVVIGIGPNSDHIILRSGTEKRLLTPAARFLKTWQKADKWGLVLLKPGEFPANPDSDRYLEAVAGLESSGKISSAGQSYKAALQRWPDHPVALFGLANSYQQQQLYGQSVQTYRQLLSLRPGDPAVTNNLADTLNKAGCFNEALATIEKAMETQTSSISLQKVLLQTRTEVLDDMIQPGIATECLIPESKPGMPERKAEHSEIRGRGAEETGHGR